MNKHPSWPTVKINPSSKLILILSIGFECAYTSKNSPSIGSNLYALSAPGFSDSANPANKSRPD